MSNPLFDVLKKDGNLNASHVIEAARSIYGDKVTLKTAGGKNKACKKCSRVLLWTFDGESYLATCRCGESYWEWKPKTEGR